MLLRTVETLIVAALGGAVLHLIGFPAGLVSGSVLAVAIAALAGRPMQVADPDRARDFRAGRDLARRRGHAGDAQGHRDMAAQHRRAGGRDRLHDLGERRPICGLCTAGMRFPRCSARARAALAQVMALSIEYGARPARHRGRADHSRGAAHRRTAGGTGAVRIGGARPRRPRRRPAARWRNSRSSSRSRRSPRIATLWFRLPGGLLFGAMIGSGVLHGAGFIDAVLPWWAASAAVDRAWRHRRRALRQHPSARAGELHGRGVRLVRGGGVIAACFALAVASVLSIRVAGSRRRVLTRRAGHHDGARARAASRPGVRRGASRGAFPGGVAVGAAARAAASRRRAAAPARPADAPAGG